MLAQTATPMSGADRVKWTVKGTLGPASLTAGLFSAGWGTWRNEPKEYGTHWEGFGKRYGLRVPGVAASAAMESGLGAIWGEDPRYMKSGGPVKQRLKSIVKQTFFARHDSGGWHPAYARYAAISGSNFLSNTWRPDSEATTRGASIRIVNGFLGRMLSNAFGEFGGDAFRRVRRKH